MATGGFSDGHDDIDQLLLCQICLLPLVNRKPRQLSCLHTFCEQCLEEILRKKPGNHLTCAICRQVTKLPGSLSNLPLNFNIDQANQMAKALVITLFCEKCSKQGEFLRATFYCLTCEWLMCDTCRNVHDKLPGYSSHQIQTLRHEQLPDTDAFCKTHTRLPHLFCQKCELLVCKECLTDCSHDSHLDDLKTIEEAGSVVRHMLTGRMAVLKEKLNLIDCKINAIVERSEELSKTEAEMCQYVEYLKSQITEQMGELRKTLTEKYRPKMEKTIQDQKSSLSRGNNLYIKLNHLVKERDTLLLLKVWPLLRELVSYENDISRDDNKDKLLIHFRKGFGFFHIGRLEMVVSGGADSLDKTGLTELAGQAKKGSGCTSKLILIRSIDKDKLNLSNNAELHVAMNGGAVFVTSSEESLVKINCKGKKVSQYMHHSQTEIISVSAYNDNIIFVNNEEDCIYEVSQEGKKLVETRTRRIPGIKANKVCLDSTGNIIMFGGKLITKIDNKDNIIWQKILHRKCDSISVGLLDGHQCYLFHFSKSFPDIEIWNDKGSKIGRISYSDNENKYGKRSASVTPAGTFVVTNAHHSTVSEYAPDGTFIGHLLTKEDGMERLENITCDKDGNIWVDQGIFGPIRVYKL